MKNKLGQSLTLEQAKEMWNTAKDNAAIEHSMDLTDLLDDKACGVYHERLFEAEKQGMSDEELFAIDAKDVTLTFGDCVEHYVGCTRLGSFLQTLHYWLTIDPCYYH